MSISSRLAEGDLDVAAGTQSQKVQREDCWFGSLAPFTTLSKQRHSGPDYKDEYIIVLLYGGSPFLPGEDRNATMYFTVLLIFYLNSPF